MLTGKLLGAGGTGGAAAVNFTEITSGYDGSGRQLTYPSVTAGDLIIGFGACRDTGGTRHHETPTGWTLIQKDNSGSGPCVAWGISAKILTGSETGSFQLVGSGDSFERVGYQILRPDVSINSIAGASEFDHTIPTSGTPFDQTADFSTATAPILLLGTYNSSATIAGESWTGDTPDHDITVDADLIFKMSSYGAGASLPSITVGMNDEGSYNCLMIYGIELTL